MGKPYFREFLVDVAFTSVGLFALLHIVYKLEGNPQGQAINFATFPIIIALGIVLLSGGRMLVSGWRSIQVLRHGGVGREGHEDTNSQEGPSIVGLLRFLGTVVAIFGYTSLLQSFNFFYLTTALLFLLFLLYGKSSLWKVVPMSVAGGAAMYFLFVTFLNLPL